MPVSEEADPKVVVNGEGSRSIWPANRASPAGWPDEATRPARIAPLDDTDGLLPNEPGRAATADAEAW
ncbi:MbtH family NRPS accessory protein [Streptomyces sp. NPDC006602]|uniref:MbtH family NRPS accessory protein n=1 Tax=Streptomyces sp. NPDC006602 TaxID=3364751 RepID=UPI00369D4FD1